MATARSSTSVDEQDRIEDFLADAPCHRSPYIRWDSQEPLLQLTDLSHVKLKTATSITDAVDHDETVPTTAATSVRTTCIRRLVTRWRLTGWRAGVAIAAATTALVFLVNTALAIWLSIGFQATDGIRTVYTADCKTVGNVSLGIHLVINVLSSLLLSASNYTMQCLAAPTRQECDRAHACHKWLDIGSTSVRNLSRIQKMRALIWLVLAITSMPFHLIYNSMLTKVLTTNQYNVVQADRKCLNGIAFSEQWQAWSLVLDSQWDNGKQCITSTTGARTMTFGQGLLSCPLVDCQVRLPQHAFLTNFTMYELLQSCNVRDTPCQLIESSNVSRALLFDRNRDSGYWDALSQCVVDASTCLVKNEESILQKPTLEQARASCMVAAPNLWFESPAAGNLEEAPVDMMFRYNMDPERFTTLSSTDCMEIYNQDYLTAWNDLLVIGRVEKPSIGTYVVGQATDTAVDMVRGVLYEPLIGGERGSDLARSRWVCADATYSTARRNKDQSCDLNVMHSIMETTNTSWTVNQAHVDYCLAEKVPDLCKIHFNIALSAIIIVCIFIKAMMMLLTLLCSFDEPFVLLGDAIKSYLERPASAGLTLCWLSHKLLLGRIDLGVRREKAKLATGPRRLASHRVRTCSTISVIRVLTTVGFEIAMLTTAAVLLSMAVETARWGLGVSVSPWSTGLGTPKSQLTISSSRLASIKNHTGLVLLSNTPQLLLSIAYLLLNNALTIMLLSREWSSYMVSRKTLRVSTPHGQQRSTYFLHVPYRYGVPLLLGSTLLHWLVSTSFFLIEVESMNRGVPNPDQSSSTIGYSPLAILLSICLGSVMLLCGLGLGLRTLPGLMPVASTNSLAISAACMRPEDDDDASQLPVQWGEVEATKEAEVGHCCFTSFPVSRPLPGKLYA